MKCSVEGCDHELFGSDTCACHLDMGEYMSFDPGLRVEAVRIAALENDRFEVNAEGEIRMKEEE